MYFVTICTKNRELFFGDVIGKYHDKFIEDAEIRLSIIGQIADKFWTDIPKYFPFVELNEHVVMPNHIHGIIGINKNDYYRMICEAACRDVAVQRLYENVTCRDVATQRLYEGDYPKMSKISPTSGSLSTIIRSYKSIVTKTVNQKFKLKNNIWQPKFYDRIIRNEYELNRIKKYIQDN